MKFFLENEPAYDLVQQRLLQDIHAEGYYLLHKKSKARVVVIANDDPNKVFYIGFRTPPEDSTGTPHIIEHSVLCGSEKFPVKDPFIELVKGSLNTFLNAMTYPDKTVYPVASCNDKDFQNLMDVYMDAVLHPNIYREEKIFRQEGWHYELDTPEDELVVNGVVYNEMKGAFSVGDSVVERSIQRSLYPDTPYRHESGGDPDVIPELTYEQFLDFHRTYYHPSNSYIYLYGNMDVAEKLRWLDEAYLSAYDERKPDSALPLQTPFATIRRETAEYSIASSESEEDNTYLAYNWSVGTNLDAEQYVAFDILDYALLGSQGAPIKQALVDAGIGDDIYGGYDSGIYQPYFSVVAKHANPSDADRFEEMIKEVLREQVKNGVNKTTLLSAINGAEFKCREADFGRYPKGLMFGLQLLDSWLYDDAAPFLLLDELDIYDRLRKKLDSDYFESLIRTYLLDNSHASRLVVLPKKGLTAQKEQAQRERLQALKDTLAKAEVDRLIRETEALAAYQEAPSTKEELDTIPLLSREDMKKTSDPYSNLSETVENVPFIRHDYDTNGIVYLDYLFDAHHIPEDKVPYLGVLKTLLGRLDTEEYAFLDLSNEIHLHTGGLRPELTVTSLVKEADAYAFKLELRMRTLSANLEKTIRLAVSVLLHTLFTDDKRIMEVLAQTRSQMKSDLRSSGHTVAAGRVLSYTSPVARLEDLIGGISQYRLLERLVDHYDEEKDALKETLSGLVRSLFTPDGMMVSCTADGADFAAAKELTKTVIAQLFSAEEKKPCTVSLPDRQNEGFLDASQIQYVALAGNFMKQGFPFIGALRVFRCIMNYDYLWQNVRVRGGAYGCSCNATRSGNIYFASYRDPNLDRTLEVYRGVVAYLEQFDADEREMTRYVIGTFSDMDVPLNPAAMGRRSLMALLSGQTYEMTQKERDEVLSVTATSIRNLAPYLNAVMNTEHICAIGNEEKLKQQAELFAAMEAL